MFPADSKQPPTEPPTTPHSELDRRDLTYEAVPRPRILEASGVGVTRMAELGNTDDQIGIGIHELTLDAALLNEPAAGYGVVADQVWVVASSAGAAEAVVQRGEAREDGGQEKFCLGADVDPPRGDTEGFGQRGDCGVASAAGCV